MKSYSDAQDSRTPAPDSFQQLLTAARHQDLDARNRLLAMYRPRLRAMIAGLLSPHEGTESDVSDVIQQSLMEMHRDLQQFHGTREEEFLRWLKTIVRHNVADFCRYSRRQKRDIAAQISLEWLRDADQCGLADVAGDQSSPSTKARRKEAALRLHQAIDELPADQAHVVRLRHLQHLTLDEIVAQTGRSKPAIAGLLARASSQLRNRLKALEASSGER